MCIDISVVSYFTAIAEVKPAGFKVAGSNRPTSSDPPSILGRVCDRWSDQCPLVVQHAVAQEGVRHVKSEFTGRPLQGPVFRRLRKFAERNIWSEVNNSTYGTADAAGLSRILMLVSTHPCHTSHSGACSRTRGARRVNCMHRNRRYSSSLTPLYGYVSFAGIHGSCSVKAQVQEIPLCSCSTCTEVRKQVDSNISTSQDYHIESHDPDIHLIL